MNMNIMPNVYQWFYWYCYYLMNISITLKSLIWLYHSWLDKYGGQTSGTRCPNRHSWRFWMSPQNVEIHTTTSNLIDKDSRNTGIHSGNILFMCWSPKTTTSIATIEILIILQYHYTTYDTNMGYSSNTHQYTNTPQYTTY